MLAAGGVHPYVLRRRRNALFRAKAEGNGLGPSLVLVILFLAGFACGLRWIDQRLAPTPHSSTPSPAREWDSSFSEQLSEGVRFILGVKTAQAAEFDSTRYKAQPEKRVITVTAEPGGEAAVEIRFKNLGTAVWSPEGQGYISVYTTQPRYHAGVLRHANWISASQPAKLSTASVAFGETGTVKFMVKAPTKAGTYSEWIQLAAEDTSWVYGGHVQLVMNVKNGAVVASAPSVTSGAQSTDTAILLLRSAQRITAAANTDVAFTVGYKNGGSAAWNERALKFKEGAAVAHSSWSSADTPVRAAETVPAGRIGFLDFTLKTPKTRGEYAVRFVLVVDGREVPESLLEIPITVTDDWYEAPKAAVPVPATDSSIVSLGGAEPIIRVGLYYSEIEREEYVADVPYEVRSADGVVLASLQAGSPIQAWYDAATGSYRLTNGIIDVASPSALRFVPLSSNGVITALSHVDRPSWNLSLNDNRFRGIIELRRHSSGRVWAINELPMEQYLWGLAETSNSSPMEFMRTLAVAARSYGYWHLTHPGKYDDFTVGALNDQVYKGFGAEIRYPRFKAAVDSTRGQVVFYNDENVITPYYSWSDGRTRSWAEVWGGSAKPWLVSVAAPYDAGKSLNGHGVGMSAWDSIGRANAGELYDAMLRYYYQGTELRKLY